MLTVSDYRVSYGQSEVLHGLNFSVKPKEIVAILGRNGMGKTTLMKSLMGVIPSTSGSVTLQGKEMTSLKSYQRVANGFGFVPQGRMIFSSMTVKENIETGLTTTKKRSVPRELYDMFPVLLEMRNRRGGNLSGGQQQQLAIARALVAGPRLLMLDEPTEGIQPSIIKDIGRAIRKLADEGLNGQKMAVVLVEQFYDFAEELADQYLVMERGEIIRQGRGENMAADGVRQLMSI